jgi:hypothetical protein
VYRLLSNSHDIWDEEQTTKEGFMEEHQQSTRSHLFLVRIWQDRRDEHGGEEPWHGKVQHAVTGKVALFDGRTSLVDLMISLLPDRAPPDAASHDKDATDKIPVEQPHDK